MRFLFASFLIVSVLSVMFTQSSCGVISSETDYDRAYFDSFPAYAEVVTNFYSLHPEALGNSELLYRFEKKEMGWYVAERLMKSPDIIKNKTQVWDAKTKRFSQPTKTISDQDQQRIKHKTEDYQQSLFDHCPVFGYPEAQKNIVGYLENVDDLTDEECECLARAYSHLASKMLVPAKTEATFNAYDSTFKKEAFDGAYMEQYHKYGARAIATFERLKTQNPRYETTVGSAKMKYANEHMVHFYETAIIQHTETHSTYLKAAIYDAELLKMYKNYLVGCPENAILFTWGDNDTYPLLYLQEKQGVRKDVTIVNANLANLGRYIYYLTHVLPENKRLKTGLGIEHYKLSNNEFLMIDQSTKFMYFEDFMTDFKTNPGRYVNEQYTNQDRVVRMMPSKVIGLQKNADSLALKLNLKSYFLFKRDLFMLDVITSNIGKRAICFSITFPRNELDIYSNYLELRGLHYELLAKQAGDIAYAVDAGAVADYIYAKIEVPTLMKEAVFHREYRSSVSHHLLVAYKLMDYYYNTDQKEALIQLLTDMRTKWPVETTPYGRFALIYATYLGKMDDFDNARVYLDASADEIEALLNYFQGFPKEKQYKYADQLEDVINWIGELREAADNLGATDLMATYQERFLPYLSEQVQ